MTNNPLNFALVGCGVIAPCHARCISELENAHLVAVCDIIELKARKLAQTYPADIYADYHELIRRDDIDVVCVLTPSGLHAEVGIAAAEAGKHVIVEKPMDVNLSKADMLIDACRKAGVKLCCISQHRFDFAVQDLKQAIEAGKLGTLNFCGSYTQWYRSQSYYDSGDWRGTWALDGGGALMNQSIHYVDLLQYVMGPVDEVFALTAIRSHKGIEVEDIAVATVKFHSGAVGVIEGMTLAYPGFCARLEVFGTDGGVIIENDQVKAWQLRTGDQYDRPAGDAHLIVGTTSADIWHHSHRRQIADMMQAIWEDREPLCNGPQGRMPLEIVLSVYQSACTHQPVRVQSSRNYPPEDANGPDPCQNRPTLSITA
jgi:UDP-N-acetyl-2-amino-2-deoxyglucuronate dehydrogenase